MRNMMQEAARVRACVCASLKDDGSGPLFRESVLSKEASISGVFCAGRSSQGQQLKECSL